MKEYIKLVTNNALFSGSAVMIIGSNLVNASNYLYHVIMGRLLGPSAYGELSALFSLISLLGIIPMSFGLVIIKFISSAKKEEETKGLINWFSRRIYYLAIFMTVCIILLSPLISAFLNIKNNFLIILIAGTFLFSLPSFLNKSVLQGLLRFKEMIISILAESGIKLILGVILVLFGFSVAGAIGAITVAALVSFIISRNYLLDYTKIKGHVSPSVRSIILFTLPVLCYSFATTSLISTDLLLVKHFFTSHDAGVYAAASTLGRIIFFGTAPIASVMFPLISKRKSEGQEFDKIFLYSLGLTFFISLGVIFLYLLLPVHSVNILYGSVYVEATKHLVLFGIFIALFSLSISFVSFFLSLNKTKMVLVPVLAALLQALGIWLYHGSLREVIFVSIMVCAAMLVFLCTYYFWSRFILRKI